MSNLTAAADGLSGLSKAEQTLSLSDEQICYLYSVKLVFWDCLQGNVKCNCGSLKFLTSNLLIDCLHHACMIMQHDKQLPRASFNLSAIWHSTGVGGTGH